MLQFPIPSSLFTNHILNPDPRVCAGVRLEQWLQPLPADSEAPPGQAGQRLLQQAGTVHLYTVQYSTVQYIEEL